MFNSLYQDRRVFVTGDTGFKGSWLCMWLTMLGAKVTGYALPPAYEDSHFELLPLQDRIHHITGDIRNLDTLKKALDESQAEIVFHLAAQALVREAYRDPKTTFDTNVGGSVNVLEAVRRCSHVRALVYVTSDKCYRNVEWEWGYRENDILGGKDPYSASKGCAEIVFASYLDSFLKDRTTLHAASARAGNVIGGGDWAKDRIVPDCIRALRNSQPIIIRSPRATRPWQHVLEPLGAYLLLGAALYGQDAPLLPRSSFNFGPEKTSNKTVLQMVNRIIHHWGSGEVAVKEDPLAPHEDMLLQLNCDRAYHFLKWRPLWHYEESVRETTLWYKQVYQEAVAVETATASQIEKYMAQWEESHHAC